MFPNEAINPSGPGISTECDTLPSDSHGIVINPSACAVMTDVIKRSSWFSLPIFYCSLQPSSISGKHSQLPTAELGVRVGKCYFSHSLQPILPTTNYAVQIGRNNTGKHVSNIGFIIITLFLIFLISGFSKTH